MRKKVTNRRSYTFGINDPRRLPGATTLWGVQIVDSDRELVELNFGLWGLSKLGVEFKQFLFNLVQGKLYLNNVLHRIDNTPEQCTFCRLIAIKDLSQRNINEDRPEYLYYINLQPREDLNHLFWDCMHVNHIIQKCYRWIRGFDWLRGDETIGKNSFFLGISHPNKIICTADLIWKHFTKFFIYSCRKQKKIPKFPSLKYEIEGIFGLKGMYRYRNAISRINSIYT